jgi:hypothetical protein
MILCGLAQNGYDALAHDIALACVDHATCVFTETGTVWENYAPEYAAPGMVDGHFAAKDFVGWSGLFHTSILYEFVFGVKSDPVHGRLRWDVRLTDAHGIADYPFGDASVNLRCEARATVKDEPAVTIEASCPIEAEIIWEGGSKTIAVNR